jgi:hypothetical protein
MPCADSEEGTPLVSRPQMDEPDLHGIPADVVPYRLADDL